MRILILGGTGFIGRHLTELAIEAGHEVTLFNRGHSAGELFPEVETLAGDRGGDLKALKGRTWDCAFISWKRSSILDAQTGTPWFYAYRFQ